MFKNIICISIITFAITGCGGGSNNSGSSNYQTIYDENINGSLPYTLFSTSDVYKYTLAISEGTNTIKGTSSSLGESFIIQIPANLKIYSINVKITTAVENNSHTFSITSSSNGASVVNQVQSLLTGITNSYQITPNSELSNGSYYIHTNTAGTELNNDPFVIEFIATKK